MANREKDKLSEKLEKKLTAVNKKFGKAILKHTEFRGELGFEVQAESAKGLLKYCKMELGFGVLVDISSVDLPEEELRFIIVYHLYSLAENIYMRVNCRVRENEKAESVCDIWQGADWHEREIYDMMGIKFNDHPNLKRILMWEGYPYFPLRKDFPLAGKKSLSEEIAFSEPAPLEGGPFTAKAGDTRHEKEPRASG